MPTPAPPNSNSAKGSKPFWHATQLTLELVAIWAAYLRAVKEIMRFYSLVDRIATKDDVIKPYIDKQVKSHDDRNGVVPGVWANVLTFSGKPHNCIGFRFALVEIKALLFTLIRAFEF
ncbi:hypothetical protein DFH07DRAFT_1003726 [Mycena maculata]|uniref:Cytochrome P450 n=1 Tax=Mycena maculata TaxID=230809 RepID=A0AAD7HNF2_9AGAR|nr:hypothetical protein DFH07DRAFT_1003726 [Mycena maculata]